MVDELIDLVDDKDQLIDTITRSQANDRTLLNFRAIHAWLVNSKGELFVPTRGKLRKLYPGGYDFSVSGQVGAGESYEDAFRRETLEELNIDVNQYEWREVAKLTPKENGAACFAKLYEIKADIEPDFDKGEFEVATWLTPKQILLNIYSGQYYKTDIPLTLRRFYDCEK
jgi:isopentenyldiphosphate isomerase